MSFLKIFGILVGVVLLFAVFGIWVPALISAKDSYMVILGIVVILAGIAAAIAWLTNYAKTQLNNNNTGTSK